VATGYSYDRGQTAILQTRDNQVGVLQITPQAATHGLKLQYKMAAGTDIGVAKNPAVPLQAPALPQAMIGKVVRQPAELLAGLPADAWSADKGWDEFSKPKADKWLAENVTEWGLEAQFEVRVKSVALKRISPKDKLTETLRWDADVTFELLPVGFQKQEVKLKLDGQYVPDPNATLVNLHLGDPWATVSGDEDFARRVKALHAGDKVVIRGTIEKASVWETNPPTLWVLLHDQTLEWPADTAPSTNVQAERASEGSQ
jgi:hypothetical protein